MIPQRAPQGAPHASRFTPRGSPTSSSRAPTLRLQGPGARVPRGAPVPAGRRRAHHRLERLGAHERDLREGLRRRARDDGDARRRSLGERALRHAARASKARVAAEIAALCAFSAIKNNDRVGLILGDRPRSRSIVPPKKGEKHVMRVVREILGFEPEHTGTDLKLAARDALQGGAPAQRRVRGQRLLRARLRARARARRGEARRDPGHARRSARRELPDVGLATFEDFETGEDVVVDTGDKRVRAALREDDAPRARRAVGTLQEARARQCVVRTDRAFVEPLRELFARSAKRIRSR